MSDNKDKEAALWEREYEATWKKGYKFDNGWLIDKYLYCSKCGHRVPDDWDTNYCSSCGAKMRKLK